MNGTDAYRDLSEHVLHDLGEKVRSAVEPSMQKYNDMGSASTATLGESHHSKTEWRSRPNDGVNHDEM